MLNIDFPGSGRLIKTLDNAVACGTVPAIVNNLRSSLSGMIQAPDIQLPDCVFEPCSENYARRELYRSQQFGYVVVAMTWGPDQGTPIHDHNGMWCVEGVWQGELEITHYEKMEQSGSRFRFKRASITRAGAGSAGSLIPPHEYHAIVNPSDTEICVSLHIYSGAMTQCSIFTPLSEDWYQRDQRQLSLDQTA